ncbi:hybrid sensor histidine kinase/response regulator transcription factor [Reichenbachiella ulvae]|uniref:histidine kinase n=1 Tax=Reichenbachiella ulvae TaxID=2980104 RepID=A0ABT3CTP6_9BACT|nr:two-component regulator propeller domain-containing protein [Reichenbachiella ulvae]MCV9387002.1 ATP-binding protein [Reichenbachiella ulvae]
MNRILVTVFLMGCLVQLAIAQPESILTKNVYFEQPQFELGLSQRSINSVIQDHEGYLWVATWSGLIKYDGYSTEIYRADNTTEGKLKSNKIGRVFESSDSTLWVATRSGGLFRKDAGSEYFHQYTYTDGCDNCLSNPHVWDMVEDSHGNLWIATENGLNFLDRSTEQFTSFFFDESDISTLSNSFITRLMIDPYDRLWVGTEYGLNLLENMDPENAEFRRIEVQNVSASNYVYDIAFVENATGLQVFWGTKNGLNRYSNGEIESFVLEGKPSSFSVFRSMEVVSSKNPFLLLGSDMGLSVFDINNKSFDRFFGDFDRDVNLSQNTIQSITLDQSGVLWAGTLKGINKYDTYDNNIGLVKTKTFDPTNSIMTAIKQDGKGDIWMSTLGGGFFHVNLKDGFVNDIQKFDWRIPGELGFTDYIQKFEIDRNDRFWVGTAGSGLFVFDRSAIDRNSKKIMSYDQYFMGSEAALSDDYVMSLCEAKGGGMWVGTWSKGLNLVTPEGEVLVFDDQRLSPIPLVTIYEDPLGYLWIGTRGDGLIRIKIQNQKIVEHKVYEFSLDGSTLSNNFVNAIHQDTKNRLWIGTEDGLNLYDAVSDHFVLINNSQSQLPKDVVGIIEDEKGQLWLTGDEGVTVIDPDEKDMYVNHFDKEDRVQGGFFYNEVTLKTNNGELMMGGSNGFNVINTNNIYQNPHLPMVALKEVVVSDKVVQPGVEVNGRILMDRPLGMMDRLELKYFENSISFEFAALHYANPMKNRYAFRLEGFDEEWHYTDASRRFAKYTNLNPGEYTFTVRASNDDGLWQERGTSLSVVIAPPWYKTQWAVFLYVIASMLFLVAFRKLILMRTAYEHDLKFERLEKENNEKLNKSRLQFFTNISHEFRTPLTLILGLLEQLMNSGDANIKVQKQLKLISQNANRLQRLINQLLDFRKAEAGSLQLKVAEGNFYKFVKEVKLSFDSLAGQKGVEFNLLTSSNVIQVFFDRDQFEKILFNLLSNAFKHTESGDSVNIEIAELPDSIVLSVNDTGQGIAEEAIHKVFDRFYSGDQESGTGSGIGLALCKSLVELHHGQISVKSELGKGTRFEVKIPKGSDHFDESQLIKDFKDSENIDLYKEVVFSESDEVVLEAGQIDKPVAELKRILLVEDNDQVRAFLKSLFQYEYAVFEAENGKDALAVAEEEELDLVISDVMMPVMDGFSFCQKMKNNLATSHIPIILLTARTSYIYNVEGLEKGADDYLTKPFHIEVLKLKVRNLISAREQSRQMVQDKTQLVLEPKMVTVTSADEIFLKKCMEIIENNMDNSEYSVVEFGKEVGLSRMQLYRKLKALTGKSPNEFIRMMRIKRAAQLFEHGDMNVSEVTYQVGFTDPAYFRKCFKDEFGETPTNYIKSKKK